MTYNQWLKQKTMKDKEEGEKPERPKPSWRYPIGRIIQVDNRPMFEQFSGVKA